MTLKEKLVQETLLLVPDVKLIYLFGSQANGSAHQNSDIDIAILLGQKIASLKRFDYKSLSRLRSIKTLI